jgi:hypothetical protein
LGQEKLILVHHKMNYGTKQGHFLGYWKVILVHIRRWSYGTFQDDNNIFHKMKNDLTTGTWQDNIWCPINIILLCTSDANTKSIILSAWPAESMILSALFDRGISHYANSGGYENKLIGDYDDCRFTTIVNSASTAAPIGLPLKMAKFCHTSNRLLVGHRHHRALWRLYFR